MPVTWSESPRVARGSERLRVARGGERLRVARGGERLRVARGGERLLVTWGGEWLRVAVARNDQGVAWPASVDRPKARVISSRPLGGSGRVGVVSAAVFS